MSIAIGTYVNFNDVYYFQNFHHQENRNWDGDLYTYSGFGYSGSTTDLQAANVDAQLVFAVNELALNLAKQAADERWIATIKTVWLDPMSLNEISNYMLDVFMIIGFEHNSSRLSFRLASPLDAITGDVPRRRLTSNLVGAMPSTGDLQLL